MKILHFQKYLKQLIVFYFVFTSILPVCKSENTKPDRKDEKKVSFSIGNTYLFHNQEIYPDSWSLSLFEYENRVLPSLQASVRYKVNKSIFVGVGLDASLRGYTQIYKYRTLEPNPFPKKTKHNSYLLGTHLLLRYESNRVRKYYFFAETTVGLSYSVSFQEKTYYHDAPGYVSIKQFTFPYSFLKQAFFQYHLTLGAGRFSLGEKIKLEAGLVLFTDKYYFRQMSNEKKNPIVVGPRINLIF